MTAFQRCTDCRKDMSYFGQYDNSRESYFVRGHDVFHRFQKGGAPECLFYAALEFRYCIEQIFHDSVAIFTPLTVTKEHLPSVLKGILKKGDPDFESRQEFGAIIDSVVFGDDAKLSSDLARLKSLHGKLGGLLHTPEHRRLQSIESDAWFRAFDLVHDADKILCDIINGGSFFPMNKEGNRLFEFWKVGLLSDDDVLECIRTMLEGEEIL